MYQGVAAKLLMLRSGGETFDVEKWRIICVF